MGTVLKLRIDPSDYARALLRAKFQGTVPVSMAPAECVELMLSFAKCESERADNAAELIQKLLNITEPLEPLEVN
jgi:hypothetical protein